MVFLAPAWAEDSASSDVRAASAGSGADSGASGAAGSPDAGSPVSHDGRRALVSTSTWFFGFTTQVEFLDLSTRR